MNVSKNALKEMCRAFEAEHGIEAFLDTMAEVMQERLGAHGLTIRFDEDDEECRDQVLRQKSATS